MKMLKIAPISPEQRTKIFEQFVTDSLADLRKLPRNAPVIVIFSETRPGSRCNFHSASLEQVSNTVKFGIMTRITTFQILQPPTDRPMASAEEQFSDLKQRFYSLWRNKSATALVFMCVYPGGLDENPNIPDFQRELFGGVTETSFFRIEPDGD